MNVYFALLQGATALLILAVIYRPLGDYIAHTVESRKDLAVERGLYRLVGVDPRQEQTWRAYLRGVLAFSLLSLLLLYLLQRAQAILPLSLGLPPVEPDLAFNTAASFITNTNWQSYSPETTMGYAVQLLGLAVQNFLSAGVGIAVAIALVRGFSRVSNGTVGNFWVDLTRITLRLLLPLTILATLALVAGGVIQNLNGFTEVTTLTGATQSIPGGPVASQEAIKLLGTNGGGFFAANSSHPFENPTAWTNLLQVILMLAIPFSLPRTLGRLVGNNKQGYAILAAMGIIFIVSIGLLTWAEASGSGTAPELAGAALEGKEQRFGIAGSTLFGGTSTLTSTGAVNSMHASNTAFGILISKLNMMLGEVAPGGVGSGLYGMLILAVITVFIAGLLVGRTPEILGKKIGPIQMKLASLYILVTPTLILLGTALSFAIPAVHDSVVEESILNPGSRGMSEVLYAFTSAANNNGSALAGLVTDTPWFNVSLGVTMILARFIPIVLVLALAGSLAAQPRIPRTVGTLPTNTPLFTGMLIGVTLIITALTYFPILALGPLAEGLQ
ncbi:potassium-transporting ATPase subunit KdpA [Lysinibacter sp. HNR]|uniref:potassium-transporting ATPase subunit KdpA n=1 Tax=Lysinibacter sp. HNR TaxID=3031408 RepID=UPI002434ECBB|nr:potassium-transporting ATPase subunit KdpA [Lysinibacter sp. HNR]WGD37952.1 potassium-transporting ATPase subunit KdpA [Lysinibacter sp. HNR]